MGSETTPWNAHGSLSHVDGQKGICKQVTLFWWICPVEDRMPRPEPYTSRTSTATAAHAQVNITWAAISNDQLNALLSSKRTVAMLRITGATALTSLSPGLDNLNAVTGDVSLTALTALETLELPALV